MRAIGASVLAGPAKRYYLIQTRIQTENRALLIDAVGAA
jgi:hypothetical protein